MPKILIVDDQSAVRTALEVLFQVHGLETVAASNPQQALELVASEDVGVVVQDMNFSKDNTSGREGMELFRALRKLDPELPILLMTAWTSLETAVELVKEGAVDYLAKPWDDHKLVVTVQNLLRIHDLGRENLRLRGRRNRARTELSAKHDLCGLVYESAEVHALVELAIHVAASDAPVLITGPNGAGKERLAQIVQANSRRRDKPFVAVNVGALPDNLLEAELFGAEPGAYTGATKLRVGRFEAAHGGTLFLDEIGNLSANGQMRLLRVLQTGEFERLGSSTTRKVDVRVVSATNADLKRAIREGRFREDLFFRLNVIELMLPPLVDRVDDVLPLARHFLTQLSPDTAVTLDDSAERALVEYDWPGNVRELQNRMQRAVLVCKNGVISAADLALPAAEPEARAALTPRSTPGSANAAPRVEGDDNEREQIEAALARAQGVVSRAAAELGLSRQALYRRMDRLGMVVERRVRGVDS
ncbi:MAG: sigma-54 dependent transcriptional regulator [Polyangiaceae bacterium]